MVPGYREVRQLGAGRTGRVFLATYQETGAYVAIKYLNATLRRDTEFMDRFRSDTHRLVEIDSPDVVRLYEYVETATRAALVMELVDGVSLRTLLAEHGRIAPEAALAVVKSTLLALAAAHERGVAHRDVTPGNILVQADGTTQLTDFGVVVHAEEPGVPAGSPPYMAPELWTQGRDGPPADVYAAACVLFEAVRGRPPYRTENGDGEQDVPALRDKHLVEPVPVEVAPDTLRDLLRRGMAKDPAVRYASARQFAAELEEDAAAGYGPDWEKRGRRHLAELATLLALRFPLARTGPAPSNGLRSRLPRLPPQLWVAGGAVVAAVVAILVSGGGVPPGPGTILLPPPEVRDEPAPATTSPAPTRSSPAPRRTAASPSPPATRTAAPPSPRPTRSGQPGTSAPIASVRAATILRWNGTAGTIGVSADGTGGGAAADRVHEEGRRRRGGADRPAGEPHPARPHLLHQRRHPRPWAGAVRGAGARRDPRDDRAGGRERAAGQRGRADRPRLPRATHPPTATRPAPPTTDPSPSPSTPPATPPSNGPEARSSAGPPAGGPEARSSPDPKAGLSTPTLLTDSPEPSGGSPEPAGEAFDGSQGPAGESSGGVQEPGFASPADARPGAERSG
ncbi:protein kinase domain-containing protein [Nonomuraea salmonea]|uniref:protein kinase domain-containing protein n=1 Tax=Nonomuraea salmonea TaxID=46181 RepID=UPI002FE7A4E3